MRDGRPARETLDVFHHVGTRRTRCAIGIGLLGDAFEQLGCIGALDLRDRFNQTFVIVTHDEGLAAMCDRTLKMRDGRIIDQTTNNQQCDDCQ